MNDYKPNSNRFKEEQKQKEQEKKIEKVVTGQVITKKKSGLSKLANEFISEDAKNIKSFVLGDVLIPVIKKALYDIGTGAIDMILYGGSKPGGKRSIADTVSYVNYSNKNTRAYRDARDVSNYSYSYDDIILDNRGEAEAVLDRMFEIIDTYEVVSVADYKELVGVPSVYTDNKYGWTNLRGVETVRVRNGYMIKLPRAVPIN